MKLLFTQPNIITQHLFLFALFTNFIKRFYKKEMLLYFYNF